MQLSAPTRALVLGGGDGGVLRELVRFSSIEHIDMVEIDQMVIDSCIEHLPTLSAGAFSSSKVHLTVGDAFAFVQDKSRKPYDLIVLDATDTYEDESGELSEALFTRKFYEDCGDLLKPDGIVVTQADNLLFCPYSLDSIRNAFASVFTHVGAYWSIVPSYGGFSGFCWASDCDYPFGEYRPSSVQSRLRYLSESAFRMGTGPLPFDPNLACRS